MKLLAFITALIIAMPAFAAVEPSYDPSKPRATTPWYGVVTVESKKADLDFVAGMRPHHAGALTMSDEYLASKDASSALLQQLARGIIHNQKFEIGMLDTVEKNIKSAGTGWAQIATKGLAQRDRFMKAPAPGPMDSDASVVSKEDVRFAKAMIVHHQGALDMANEYLANPHATNGYLRLMCLDILVDQAQEIAFMQSVIDAYPGNPDDVKIDPSMVHGMEGMSHGGHGHHH